MTIQNFGDFQYNDELTLEENLANHANFVTKNNKSSWDKDFKSALKAETENVLKLEKEKWTIEQNNLSLLNSIDDTTNKNIVDRLLKGGTSVDEIKKDFSQLLVNKKQENIQTQTPINTTVSEILQFTSSNSQNTEIEKILSKNPKDWTDDEILEVGKYNASTIHKGATKAS